MSTSRRQQLHARISDSSKTEVILEEMVRHGFWQRNDELPSLPEELLKQREELSRELVTLAADAHAYKNRETALKLLQKERMKAARERRQETKLRNAQARYDRALAWHQRQSSDITHLGDRVSAALHGVEARPERLAESGLPPLADPEALAAAMGIALGELRFLAYNRDVSRVDHYARFVIPKKTGGLREISAPKPRLKRAQYWILNNILAKIPGDEASHGFRPGRSIITNTSPHAGKRVVINIDLKDFFPTISYARVKGLFVGLGYAEKMAALLALVCTDAERDKVEVDGRTWSVAREGRRLPQGAPTSPAIANIIASRLDKRMAGAAKKLGFIYTRYADDMTFSGNVVPGTDAVNRMIWQARQIALDEGFKFNDKKTRVMGCGTRQDVTGLVVNAEPAVPRVERRRFRAWLHTAEKAVASGGEIPGWTNGKGALSEPLGFASYLAMVDREQGAPLVARTKAVMARTKPRTERDGEASRVPGKVSRAAFREAAAQGQAPHDGWWTPAERPEPKLEPVATPKSKEPQSQSQTSVPPVSREAPPSGAATTGVEMKPARFSRSLALILGGLVTPLVLIPGLGGFIVVVAWYVIWRQYQRSRDAARAAGPR